MEHKKNISSANINAKNTKTSAFEIISDEVQIEIFSYLDSKTLAKLAKVSKKFNAVSSDNSLWKSRINTNEANTNFKQFYVTSPHLRADEPEFYAVGNQITVAKPQGISDFYAKPIKEFSATEVLNTFNQANKILLFETEKSVKNFVDSKIRRVESSKDAESTHVIFKIKLSDINRVAEIQNTFHKVNEFMKNMTSYSAAERDAFINKIGGPDSIVYKCIAIEKEDFVVLSANLMDKHKYTFEQLNPKESRCLVM